MLKQELIDYMVRTILERVECISRIEPSDGIILLENRLDGANVPLIEDNLRKAKSFVEERKQQKLGKIQYELYSVEELNTRFGRPNSFLQGGTGMYDCHTDTFHLSDKCVDMAGLVHEITHKYQNETGIDELMERITRYGKGIDKSLFTLMEGDATRLDMMIPNEGTGPKKTNPNLKRFLSVLKPVLKQLDKHYNLRDNETNKVNYKGIIDLAYDSFRFTPLRFHEGFLYVKGARHTYKLEELGGESLVDFGLLFPQRELIEPKELQDYYQATSEKLRNLIED